MWRPQAAPDYHGGPSSYTRRDRWLDVRSYLNYVDSSLNVSQSTQVSFFVKVKAYQVIVLKFIICNATIMVYYSVFFFYVQ